MCHLFINSFSLPPQPCHPPLNLQMMWMCTLRPQQMIKSTSVSRRPKSNLRSDTATAWRGWVRGHIYSLKIHRSCFHVASQSQPVFEPRVICVCCSYQVRKEWEEAESQARNLPKAERQTLIQVNLSFCPREYLVQEVTVYLWGLRYSHCSTSRLWWSPWRRRQPARNSSWWRLILPGWRPCWTIAGVLPWRTT